MERSECFTFLWKFIIVNKMLRPQDVLEIDQKTNLETALEANQDRCTLLGQVNPVLLSNGTPLEVKEATERILQIVGGTKKAGFILGPGCALGGDTPKENIMAMLNCVR